MSSIEAEVRFGTTELRDDIPFFVETLGMRMDTIYPADDPRVAVFSGYGLRVRIEKDAPETTGTLRILTPKPDTFANGSRTLIAPSGIRVEIDQLDPPLTIPETLHSFVVRRLVDQSPWIIGRAGMYYRDLVPDRLGGAMIASHVRIPDGGPVPDQVHFHKVAFQLIFCLDGWVDVVYEDQGGPRRLTPGDCFIQPPRIRHRVLAASDECQVIEIGVPAEHVTEIDHEMTLPTATSCPTREWDGQKFVHNLAAEAEWVPFRLPGYDCRDTSIFENTGGTAGVQIVRRGEGEPKWASHGGDILFSFVIRGRLTLEGDGSEPCQLQAGDAFVIPPKMGTRLSEPSVDLEFLEVTLPGEFPTAIES
ncbi:MAG: cupin domain-containing protein [Aestuariivita sp.]|nr:cupin domain-containing protein [Aestuariivita sp.]MCY4202497.1 cupin domain-containing protein [Aestuariivita sp.]